MQNGHIESFNGRLRDECLNASWFRNLADARTKISNWHQEYNSERPHSSLGYPHAQRACRNAEILSSTWMRKTRHVTGLRGYSNSRMPNFARNFCQEDIYANRPLIAFTGLGRPRANICWFA
jgi:hypothetical protein